MNDMNKKHIQSIITRMCFAYGANNPYDLTKKMNASPGAASLWLQREKVPNKRLIQTSLDTGVTIEWLKSGEDDASAFAILRSEIDEVRTILENLIDKSVKNKIGISKIKNELLKMDNEIDIFLQVNKK